MPEPQGRWYVERAQAFIAAVRPTRMGEVTTEQITGFLTGYASEQRLSGWPQLRNNQPYSPVASYRPPTHPDGTSPLRSCSNRAR